MMMPVELQQGRPEGGIAVKPTSEEEGTLHMMFVQSSRNGRQTFAEFVAGKYQRYCRPRGIAPNDAAMRKGNKPRGFCLPRRQQIDEGSGTIHSGFIGAVVSVIVMIDGQITLEIPVRIFMGEMDTDEMIIDAGIYRSIHQPP